MKKIILFILLTSFFISSCKFEEEFENDLKNEIYYFLTNEEKPKKINKKFFDKEKQRKTMLKAKVSDLIISVQLEYGIMNSNDYINSIYEASLKYNVPPEYIVAALATESSFRENAVSYAGAIGPMQIIPRFWSGIEGYDPNIFHDNIQLGTFILSEYKIKCGGTWECAFKAYNVGITNYRNKKLIKSQEIYWKEIFKNLEKLKL